MKSSPPPLEPQVFAGLFDTAPDWMGAAMTTAPITLRT